MSRHKKRHHNTKGFRQIKRGKPYLEMKRLAAKMGVRFGNGQEQSEDEA